MKIVLAAYFLAVGLVVSYPLAGHLATGVPYTRHAPGGETVRTNVFGDHLQLHYRLWLLGDTLLGHSEPYRNRYEFSMEPGRSAPLASYFLPYSLIFLVFQPLGPAAGYNASLLAAFVLAGLAMHALVLHYTADRAAALVGGTAFAAAPYTVASVIGGHTIGLAAFLMPLAALLLERLLRAPSLRTGLAAGLGFILLADHDLHSLYFVALLCPLLVARHFLALRPRTWVAELRVLAAPLLLAVALAVAAGALKVSLMPKTETAGGPARSLREVATLAPRPNDLLRRDNESLATLVYPGAAVLLAAAAALAVAALRGRRDTPPVAASSPAPGAPMLRHALFFGALFAASLVLAFGPRFPVPAPYLFLYEHLPKFSLLRQTAKLMLPASFALALLAALGWAALRRAFPGRRGPLAVATAVAAAAIVLDASPFPGPGIGISLLPARVEAYERAFRDRPGARVVNLPIWPGNDAWTSHYLYYATLYRTVMVNGYHPIVPPGYAEQVFRPLVGLNAGQVREPQYELLRRMDVEFLILHEESFPPKVSLFPSQHSLENLRRSPYLEAVALAAPVAVFRVRAPGEIADRAGSFISSPVGVALPAWRTGQGASRPDPEAASGKALVVGADAGTVRLQRQRTTPAGRFALEAAVAPEGEARFTLAVRRGADGPLLAERAFFEGGPGYRPVALEFALEEAAPVSWELRRDGGALAVDWLSLRYADRVEPPAAFEIEELFHTGNTVADARASGGRALLLASTDPIGQATRGPYRLYPAGRYELTLSLALAGGAPPPPETPVASVILRNHLDESGDERDLPANVLMPERTVTAAALAGGGFRTATFPFVLARPAFLSLNLQHFQRGLLADRVAVTRVGG